MTLPDTDKAIGAVTKTIRDNLKSRLSKIITDVTVGRPEPSSTTLPKPRLNLFLYEMHFDPSMKNLPLDDGQPVPLWLVLKYLLTAFDTDGESDSVEAHELIGQGMRALQELSFLPLINSHAAPLTDNPETLKMTLHETSYEILSKLMQGSDEKYRFSVNFEIRPIMIAAAEPPSYSLLVGVDYTQNPVNEIKEEGIKIQALPLIGPSINQILPQKFEVSSILSISGNNLNLSDLSVRIGSVEFQVTAQTESKLLCLIDPNHVNNNQISAGSHPLTVIQTLPNGRRRSSNPLFVNLLPTLIGATTASMTRADPGNVNSAIYGKIHMNGLLLGNDNDDIFVGLYKNGTTVKIFDKFTSTSLPTEPQTKMKLEIKKEDAVHRGKYNVILRVNGQQAKNSPLVELIA